MRACTCNAVDCGPGSGHEYYCGKPENDEDDMRGELSPVSGDPELLADGSIVGWDITSRVRICFVGDTILVTGNGLHEPPTERTFTAEQLRRFCLHGLAFAERMQP